MSIGPYLASPSEENDYQGVFVTRVVKSLARVTGYDLVTAEDLEPNMLGRSVYFGDFALLCHRGDADAILNYGNALALRLWEFDWSSFVSTPSSATATGDDRVSRERVMKRVGTDNFVTGYCGRRISRNGRLFLIKNVTIWRMIDDSGNAFGVGAYFREYEYL